MRDVALVVAVTLSFAWVATAHAAILAGLIRRRWYLRAAAALVVPVLAPAWAWNLGMRKRALTWVAGALLYAASFIVSWSTG
jgi:hypothetical protein